MLGWFAETTMVASALAAVAALAGRVRPIGPTARHVLWLAVLMKMVTPPLVCWPWAVSWRELDWPSPSRPAAPAGRLPVVEVGYDGVPPMPPRRNAAIEPAGADCPVQRSPTPGPTEPGAWARIERALIAGWLVATGLLAAGQARRILRFRRRLRAAVPAPDDLVAEAERIAGQLGGRVPELLVVPELGTPMLWCLGRPRLLLPARLVKTIDRDRWRGVLAHELAHLRRGDHWVSRLELIAGLLWWWNPLYWLTRARLDAEAELACDAWVVWALPKDRLAYAETLFDIGSRLSRAASPAPALGAAGSGRFLERRLTMILREHVPCRLSRSVLLAAGLLFLLAMPSWSAITPAAEPPAVPAPALATPDDQGLQVSLADDDVDAHDEDVDADAAAVRARKKAEALAKRAEALAKRAEARAKAESKRRPKPKTKAKPEVKKGDPDVESKFEKFGPEFEKKMEAFEALGKEIEAKFGPEFEKKMEAFGEALGKELEAKFGPGSEFEEKMKKLGEELQTKLGPGSEFEKKIKDMGEQIEEKAAARAGAKAEVDAKQAKEASAKAGAKDKPKAKVVSKVRKREARIAALEAQIRKLAEELKALEAEDDR